MKITEDFFLVVVEKVQKTFLLHSIKAKAAATDDAYGNKNLSPYENYDNIFDLSVSLLSFYVCLKFCEKIMRWLLILQKQTLEAAA